MANTNKGESMQNGEEPGQEVTPRRPALEKDQLSQQLYDLAQAEPDADRRCLLEKAAFELSEQSRYPEFFEQVKASLERTFSQNRYRNVNRRIGMNAKGPQIVLDPQREAVPLNPLASLSVREAIPLLEGMEDRVFTPGEKQRLEAAWDSLPESRTLQQWIVTYNHLLNQELNPAVRTESEDNHLP